MADLVFLLVFWVRAGACQRNGVSRRGRVYRSIRRNYWRVLSKHGVGGFAAANSPSLK
jgi:hypothetical protein